MSTTPDMLARLEALVQYQAQLLWLISAQLHALLGGESYPVPDVSALWEEPASGDDILTRLKGGFTHDDSA